MCRFSIILIFKGIVNYDALKSKSPCILLNQNVNFNKSETVSSLERPWNYDMSRNSI